MNKKLKSSVSAVVLSSIISTSISPTIFAFADSENIKEASNLIQQEVTEQSIVGQEVTEQSIEQKSSAVEARSTPKYGVKSKFSSAWTIITSLITFAQNYQYIKDAFQSIRLQFKINMLGIQIRSYDKAHWVGTGSQNNPTIVKKVQKALNLRYPNLTPLAEDGSAGPLTVERIKKFQRDQGLPVDGSCGTNTYEALFNLKNQ